MEAGTLRGGARLRAQNLIGGAWQGACAGRTADSVNPADCREIGSYAASSTADARQAIDAARRAFDAGGLAHDPAQRALLLLAWADRLAAHPALARLLTLENGKVLAQAQAEVDYALACLRAHAHALQAGDCGAAAGVVAILAPAHAPVAVLMAALAPALAAGCTVIVTPARQSAQVTAAVLAELVAVAGVPAGVVNLVLEAGREVARELVASTGVDIVCFTGSQERGRKMAQVASPSAKRLLFDLRRKACSLVFDDVDLQAVATQLATAALCATGQHSSAPRRILVQASRFVAAKVALRRALAQVAPGAGLDPGSGMGPLIDAAAMVAVGVRTEQALARCDAVLLQGRRAGGRLADGYFLTPTLVAEDTFGDALWMEEIHGPFISLGSFADEDAACAGANGLHLAHSVSIWSDDPHRAARVAAALGSDCVLHNRHDWLAPATATRARGMPAHGRHACSILSDFLATPPH